MYMLYKHKCLPVFDACPRLHLIRNNVDVTLKAEVPSQCLQVEHANTKSNAVYKRHELQLNKFTR